MTSYNQEYTDENKAIEEMVEYMKINENRKLNNNFFEEEFKLILDELVYIKKYRFRHVRWAGFKYVLFIALQINQGERALKIQRQLTDYIKNFICPQELKMIENRLTFNKWRKDNNIKFSYDNWEEDDNMKLNYDKWMKDNNMKLNYDKWEEDDK